MGYLCLPCAKADFNPRSREWSDFLCFNQRKNYQHFNPRSREWSDDFTGLCISILAISIHAPASGATSGLAAIGLNQIPFQSTLPRVERRESRDEIQRRIMISIHAPASGATQERHTQFEKEVFQSTLPRVERHKGAGLWDKDMTDFNPRSREWSDRKSRRKSPRVGNFNPRSREWSDFPCYPFPNKKEISIHAPASGATNVAQSVFTGDPLFQSTLPRVARLRLPLSL